MKQWIGYYKDVMSDELSSNIMFNSKGWKPSTYSNEKGKTKNSSKRVEMAETYIKEKMTYWVELINVTKKVVS